ncbi:glycerophosphodiester phosphodiesterase family protein [Acuticoccus sediminis]|uniref:glycerophosphodiester phosphodiesterase family protein n=1 Tax=Acuticoccus sediminis TaxID=2184697 RepID=UPI001CFE3E36|nr:glycerophosphodiester phosphodiesterase family protein [Acuticoccus sediminis]
MTAITGHRGARNLWAENSLTGFRNAVELGCDAIEFDIHLTDAGELVVIHDPTLDRTTDGTGPVRALTPETRRSTRLENGGDCVPTLAEVLAVLAPADGLGIHAEIKLDEKGEAYPGIAGKVAAVIEAHGLAPRTHLTSFSAAVLEDCRAAAPGIARLISADEAWVGRQGGLEAFIKMATGLADLVALRHDFLAANWDEACRLWPKAQLCAWTVNDEETMRDWLARDVGHLTSDRPDLALAARGAMR